MTRARDRRGAWIHRGRWTAEVHGPARVVVPAVRAVCGDRWHWDSASHCLRVPIVFADDLDAALTADTTPVLAPRARGSRTRKAAVSTTAANAAPAGLW
jgi:hypothetical protein